MTSEKPALERVGRYELLLELGRGALGPLWAARVAFGKEEGRVVTVRRVRVDPSRPEIASRLTEGALAAMDVRHPKIVAVLDVTLSGDELCVVSEYVDGEILSSFMRLAGSSRTPLAPATVLRAGLDVLSAVLAARDSFREHGVAKGPAPRCLHGGLSPDSVLIAGYGDVMLADLGVAGAAAEFRPFLEYPELVPYRAPELFESGARADERSDVFTIGVLMWELLNNRSLFADPQRGAFGQGPFSPRADAAQQVASEAALARLRTQPIPRLEVVGRAGVRISAQIADIVARALERDPARRFQTLEAMKQAILALPRDALATPEQLSAAVDRLARGAGESRRQLLGRFLRAASESSPPESDRPTRRPERVVVPEPGAERPTLTADEVRASFPDEGPTMPGADSQVPSPPQRKTLEGVRPSSGAPSPPALARSSEAEAPLIEVQASEPPNSEAEPSSGAALTPAAIVVIGSERPAANMESLRAALQAAKSAEQAVAVESAAPLPTPATFHASVAPAPVAALPVSDPGLLDRRRRARGLALGIAAAVAVVALIALIRALAAGSRTGASTERAPEPPLAASPATSAHGIEPVVPVEPAPGTVGAAASAPAHTESAPTVVPEPASSAVRPVGKPSEAPPRTFRPRGI